MNQNVDAVLSMQEGWDHGLMEAEIQKAVDVALADAAAVAVQEKAEAVKAALNRQRENFHEAEVQRRQKYARRGQIAIVIFALIASIIMVAANTGLISWHWAALALVLVGPLAGMEMGMLFA